MLAAHQTMAQTIPGLLTIIIPRLARRGAEIASLATARGFTVAQRSSEFETDENALPDIYVADTSGELGLFYRLTGMALLGKSLLPSPSGGPKSHRSRQARLRRLARAACCQFRADIPCAG